MLHQVGRPRPSFVNRCWPDGVQPAWEGGYAKCAANAVNPAEGRKSFPSGTVCSLMLCNSALHVTAQMGIVWVALCEES